MSDSYPTMQESLSAMQREFLGCVEMHLDPPEDDALSYEVEALYRFSDHDRPLPGEVVRFKLVVSEDADEDLSERRHIVEFLPDTEGAPIARLSHSMKRIEASQGKYFWTESRFRVQAPDMPDEPAPSRQVEEEIEVYLERIREVDRGRKLQPIR